MDQVNRIITNARWELLQLYKNRPIWHRINLHRVRVCIASGRPL